MASSADCMVGVLGYFVGASIVSDFGEQPAKRRVRKRTLILDTLEYDDFESQTRQVHPGSTRIAR
jgi:hypothetical protein